MKIPNKQRIQIRGTMQKFEGRIQITFMRKKNKVQNKIRKDFSYFFSKQNTKCIATFILMYNIRYKSSFKG